MCMWCMLRFARFWVVVFDEEIVDVLFHGEPAYAFVVISCNVDTRKFRSRPIRGDFVVILERLQ